MKTKRIKNISSIFVIYPVGDLPIFCFSKLDLIREICSLVSNGNIDFTVSKSKCIER